MTSPAKSIRRSGSLLPQLNRTVFFLSGTTETVACLSHFITSSRLKYFFRPHIQTRTDSGPRATYRRRSMRTNMDGSVRNEDSERLGRGSRTPAARSSLSPSQPITVGWAAGRQGRPLGGHKGHKAELGVLEAIAPSNAPARSEEKGVRGPPPCAGQPARARFFVGSSSPPPAPPSLGTPTPLEQGWRGRTGSQTCDPRPATPAEVCDPQPATPYYPGLVRMTTPG